MNRLAASAASMRAYVANSIENSVEIPLVLPDLAVRALLLQVDRHKGGADFGGQVFAGALS